jgi:hypothetical protein
MFSALLTPNFMRSFGTIGRVIFEICLYVRTYGRTDVQTTEGAYFIDPFGFQPETN